MRKFYLVAVFALGMVFSADAQFTDDIEAYSLGPVFTPRWTTWDGNNDGTQNIVATDEQARSGSQSMTIGPTSTGQDAVLDFQGDASAGIWSCLFYMYVPTGNSGYFNIQGNVDPSANDNLQFLSGDIYFNQGGADPGQGLDANANGEQTFSFPHDAWFPVAIEVNMDTEEYTLTIDGTALPAIGYNAAADRFAGIDFFAAEATTTYFIDDVQLVQGELGADSFSSDVFSVYPNPVKDFLTIESSEVVDAVVVYDVLGKAVLQASPDRISPRIDMSGLSSGAYMVKVTIGNASKTIKVLK